MTSLLRDKSEQDNEDKCVEIIYRSKYTVTYRSIESIYSVDVAHSCPKNM